MQNKIVIGHELDTSKKKLYDHITDFKKSIDNKYTSLITNTKIHNLGWNDSLRAFLSDSYGAAPALNKLLISSISSINKTCPLALPLYFDILTTGIDEYKDAINYSRFKSQSLLDAFKLYDDGFIQENIDVLSEALYEAGVTGSISIEQIERYRTTPYISSFDGFRSLCSLNDFFVSHLPTTQSSDCYIIPTAGSIIEVSEIHHILEMAYETKSTVIIIASSFSDDVSNTLFVNWQQGKTNVFPFTIEDSLSSINEIKDLCTILGVIPISTDTGLRMSSIDLKDYSGKSFLYDAKSDTLRIIVDYKGSIRVNDMRSRLQAKLNKETVQDVIDILSERISRMSSRSVEVHLDFEASERGLVEDRAAAFFTYFSRCAQQGVVKMGDNYPIRYLPTLEVNKARLRADKDREFINSIKAVLEIDP